MCVACASRRANEGLVVAGRRHARHDVSVEVRLQRAPRCAAQRRRVTTCRSAEARGSGGPSKAGARGDLPSSRLRCDAEFVARCSTTPTRDARRVSAPASQRR
jgi:hypothetical protein